MKWREVKILCVGMCVCTVIAMCDAQIRERRGDSLNQDNTPKPESTVWPDKEAGEISYESHTIPRVGVGETGVYGRTGNLLTEEKWVLEDSLSGEVWSVGDGCDYVNINPEDAFAQTNGQEAEREEERNLIIADVTNYVNIRSIPGEEGEILGKLYDDSVGRKIAEENGWYFIESGTVTGYVKAEFVLTGEAAKVRAREVGKRLAEVTTTTLKVRKEPSVEARVLGLVPIADILNVTEETDGWVKVDFEDGEGYVSADYVRVYTENVEAESKAEEAARLKREEEARKKAEEAAKQALAAQQAANKKPSAAKPGNSTGNNTAANHASGNSNASLGQEIANYALKFLGNPYVYGGTSLTNGADCSGFVQSVYKHFGISLPRTSGEQGKAGQAVDGVANAGPGDLVWYSGHIGIYIGNEQVVHASNPKNGIIISNVHYRKILGIRRIV